jgi:hypothetical protein
MQFPKHIYLRSTGKAVLVKSEAEEAKHGTLDQEYAYKPYPEVLDAPVETVAELKDKLFAMQAKFQDAWDKLGAERDALVAERDALQADKQSLALQLATLAAKPELAAAKDGDGAKAESRKK